MLVRRCLAGCLLFATALLAAPVQAFDLNGQWATDPDLCSKIFTRKGKEIVFSPLSDLYGSGFMVDGGRLRGKLGRCTVKSRSEDGATIDMAAGCTSSIAAQDMQIRLKVIDDNTVARLFPGLSGLEVNFHRCKL